MPESGTGTNPGPGTDGAPAGDGAQSGAGAASATLGFVSGSTYSMYASIGGGPAHEVELDTGSLGLYVPRSVLGAGAQVSSTETCSITYVSSGVTLSGHAATAAVALLGSSKSGDVTPPPTTVAMSLCAVDDPTFTGGMMGVGFGRGTSPDPTRNVLLQLADVASGAMNPGYVLSTHPAPHVVVGITPAVSAGFATLPLQPDASGNGDWLASSLHGCLTVPEAAPSFGQPCGPMLVDTGVADTLLWGPADPTLGGVVPSGQTTVPAGTAMTIGSPAAGGTALDYSFVLGTGADSPASVSIRTASAFSINTGRALLVDYDYLFDARAGLVGFRRVGP